MELYILTAETTRKKGLTFVDTVGVYDSKAKARTAMGLAVKRIRKRAEPWERGEDKRRIRGLNFPLGGRLIFYVKKIGTRRYNVRTTFRIRPIILNQDDTHWVEEYVRPQEEV